MSFPLSFFFFGFSSHFFLNLSNVVSSGFSPPSFFPSEKLPFSAYVSGHGKLDEGGAV